jgi:hypothetical protein
MKYALLIYIPPNSTDGMSKDDLEALSAEYFAIADEDDVFGGDQLHPIEAATTVRVADGETLTTDGPFADTKEVFGGWFVVEADDIDGALEVAARIPAVRMGGCVEVRPIVERPH